MITEVPEPAPHPQDSAAVPASQQVSRQQKDAGNCPARSIADGEEASPRSQQHRPEET
jgi:hypothetical protein